MKHAYLILAHNEPRILSVLVSLLDNKCNDIFIHIDAKSDIFFFSVKTHYSKCIFTRRIDVRWGDVSQIEAEFILMETARKYGQYDYYHILSGTDLPIKNRDEIYSFFDENAGKEFVEFWRDTKQGELYNKALCYNFLRGNCNQKYCNIL